MFFFLGQWGAVEGGLGLSTGFGRGRGKGIRVLFFTLHPHLVGYETHNSCKMIRKFKLCMQSFVFNKNKNKTKILNEHFIHYQNEDPVFV